MIISTYIYGHLSSVGRLGISGSMLQFVARVAFDFIFNYLPDRVLRRNCVKLFILIRRD